MGCTQSKGRPPASSPARVGASDRAAAVTASGNAQDAAHAARLHGDLDKPAKLGIGSGKVASGGKDSKLKFLGSSRGRQHSFAPQSLTESPDGPASWRRTTAPSARGSSGRQSLLLRGRVQESNGGAGSTGTSSPRGGTVGVQSGVQTRHGLQDVSSSSSSTSTRRPPPAGTLHCPGLSSSAPVLFESDCGDGPRPLLNGPKWIGSIAPARTLRRRLFSRDGRAGFARVSSVFRRRPKPGALETREGNASSSRQGIWSRRPVSSSASVDVPGSAEPHHCPRCGRTLRSSDRLSQQTHLPRQKIIGAAGPSQGATESARDPSSQDRTVFRISGRARTEGSMDVVCQRCGWPASSRPRDEGGGATGRGALGKEIPDEEGLRPLGRDCSGSTIGSELSVPAEYVVGDPLAFFNSLSHTPLFTSRIRTKLKLEQVYDVSSQILGTGISGAVRTARHRQSGRLVAVKTLNLSGIPPRRIRMLYNEVAIYLQVDHPNICKLLEVFVENGQTPKVVVPDPTEPLVNGVTPPGDSRRSSVTGDVCGQNASAKAAVVVSPGSEDLTPGEERRLQQQNSKGEVPALPGGRAPGAPAASSANSPPVCAPMRSRSQGGARRTSLTGQGTPQRCIHLVMELCTGKELYDRLARKKRYSETHAARVTRQMLSAINYCHQRHICHRDLKLENWVYRDSSDDAPLKLIDFGFSRIFHPGALMTAMHGTVYYVAPEVMDGKYNEKCDLWSIGVIVYMLLSGSPPFTGQDDQDILIKIRRCAYTMDGPRWRGISDQAKDFIRSVLMRNPEARPSAEDALKHPWLNATVQEELAKTEIDVSVLKSMQHFAACSAIKRASLGLIAMSMDSERLDDLEKYFRKIDVDNSGCIKMNRLVEVLVTFLDIPREEALRIFQRIDQSGAEEINYSEFLAATLQTRMALNDQLIREAFDRFDVDNSGHISLDNLRYVLGDSYDSIPAEDILRQCDRKQNGVIDFDEFMLALTTDEAPEGSSSLRLANALPPPEILSPLRDGGDSALRETQEDFSHGGGDGSCQAPCLTNAAIHPPQNSSSGEGSPIPVVSPKSSCHVDGACKAILSPA